MKIPKPMKFPRPDMHAGHELKSAMPKSPGSPDTRYVAGFNPRRSHYTAATGTNPKHELPHLVGGGHRGGGGGGGTRLGHAPPAVQMKHEAAPMVPFGDTMMTGES
jgi:hypothetical protein